MDMTTSENWTAETWYALAMQLEASAAAKNIPKRLRKQLQRRAEAAWLTGDWLRGVSAKDWEAECAAYQAEDENMARANNNAGSNSRAGKSQLELAMA